MSELNLDRIIEVATSIEDRGADMWPATEDCILGFASSSGELIFTALSESDDKKNQTSEVVNKSLALINPKVAIELATELKDVQAKVNEIRNISARLKRIVEKLSDTGVPDLLCEDLFDERDALLVKLSEIIA